MVYECTFRLFGKLVWDVMACIREWDGVLDFGIRLFSSLVLGNGVQVGETVTTYDQFLFTRIWIGTIGIYGSICICIPHRTLRL